jgi:chaperonin GroEL
MELSFGNDARSRMKKGIDKLADSVKCTLGPRGRHASIERKFGPPLITKDGVTVARSISLEDKLENMGAQIVKSVASNTNAEAGDGTTTATVLAQEIFNRGFEMVGMGHNPVLIKRGMDVAKEEAVRLLDGIKIDADGDKELVSNVATISANNDRDMGNLISEVIMTVGTDGMVSVEEGFGKTKVLYKDGYSFERGMISPHFVTDQERVRCVLNNSLVLVYDGVISLNSDIVPLLQLISESKKDFLIIAQDVNSEALQTVVFNNSRGAIKACIVKAPGFGDIRFEMMEDIAMLTGGTLITKDMGNVLSSVTLDMLGQVEKAEVGRNDTTLIGGSADGSKVDARVSNLKTQLEDPDLYDHQIASIRQRLSQLNGGIAMIKVGGSSEAEIRERKDRVEDAINAVQAAISEGVVPGGGAGYLHIYEKLKSLKPGDLSPEESFGFDIVLESLKAPFKQICKNAGVEFYETMHGIIRSESKTCGFDALRLTLEDDMVSKGIVDPVKVLKTGLSNAVSACGTLLTTEVAVFEGTKDE